MMNKTDVSGLSQLGQAVDLPTNPETAVLEKVPSNHAGTDFVVRFTAPEFTSL
jgi:7-cyano-7-deazaguanine reductase